MKRRLSTPFRIGIDMHKKRWITGLALLPALIYLTWLGEIYFAVFVALVGVLALSEYFRILYEGKWKRLLTPMPVAALVSAPLMILAANKFTADLTVCILSLTLILFAVISMNRFSKDPEILGKTAGAIQGMVLIPLFLCFGVLIRKGTDGMFWIFFLMAIVFAGDIGAFYTGTYLGKHKLCPSISPGKTIEGALGGLAANLLLGSLVKLIFLPRLPWTQSLIFFACVGIAGQAGDLFESEFKRNSGIKDSGVILPGHGGVLDRIDALLFALPVAYFFKKYILWV